MAPGVIDWASWVKVRAVRASKLLDMELLGALRVSVVAVGLATVTACSASADRVGNAPRPTPSQSATTVTHSLHASTETVSATVEPRCYRRLQTVDVGRQFATQADALDFASEHLLPKWNYSYVDFFKIGSRHGRQYYMRSMDRADVVAVRHGSTGWSIRGIGHC